MRGVLWCVAWRLVVCARVARGLVLVVACGIVYGVRCEVCVSVVCRVRCCVWRCVGCGSRCCSLCRMSCGMAGGARCCVWWRFLWRAPRGVVCGAAWLIAWLGVWLRGRAWVDMCGCELGERKAIAISSALETRTKIQLQLRVPRQPDWPQRSAIRPSPPRTPWPSPRASSEEVQHKGCGLPTE